MHNEIDSFNPKRYSYRLTILTDKKHVDLQSRPGWTLYEPQREKETADKHQTTTHIPSLPDSALRCSHLSPASCCTLGAGTFVHKLNEMKDSLQYKMN